MLAGENAGRSVGKCPSQLPYQTSYTHTEGNNFREPSSLFVNGNGYDQGRYRDLPFIIHGGYDRIWLCGTFLPVIRRLTQQTMQSAYTTWLLPSEVVNGITERNIAL